MSGVWVRIDRAGPVHAVARYEASGLRLCCGVTHTGAAVTVVRAGRGVCGECAAVVEVRA